MGTLPPFRFKRKGPKIPPTFVPINPCGPPPPSPPRSDASLAAALRSTLTAEEPAPQAHKGPPRFLLKVPPSREPIPSPPPRRGPGGPTGDKPLSGRCPPLGP